MDDTVQKVLLVEPQPPARVNWAKTQASFQPVQAQAGTSPSLIQQKALGFDLFFLSFPLSLFFFPFLFPLLIHSTEQLAGQDRLSGVSLHAMDVHTVRKKPQVGWGGLWGRINGAYPKRAHDAKRA